MTEAMKVTVAEFMEKYTSSGSTECGGDMVFAVNTGKGSSVDMYTVMLTDSSDFSAKLVSDIRKKKYAVGGVHHIRKSVSRKFSAVIGRCGGEAADFLLKADILAGTGSAVTADYVYFSAKSGRGERGKVTVDVISDLGGGVGDIGEIYADFYGCGSISEYIRGE